MKIQYNEVIVYVRKMPCSLTLLNSYMDFVGFEVPMKKFYNRKFIHVAICIYMEPISMKFYLEN